MSELHAARAHVAPRRWSAAETAVLLFRAWFRRRRFAALRRLSDEQLHDVGLTRDDILWGLSLPLRTDATRAVEVRRCCAARRAGERDA